MTVTVDLPATVQYGRVLGTFLAAVGGALPKGTPLTGKVVFHADLDGPPFVTAANGAIIEVPDVEVDLGANGALDISLLAGGDPDISPTGWSWTGTYTVPGTPKGATPIRVSGTFVLQPDSTVQLATALRGTKSPGVLVTKGDPGPAGASVSEVFWANGGTTLGLKLSTGQTLTAAGALFTPSSVTVTTLPPGQQATASLVGTTLSLALPAGPQGQQGDMPTVGVGTVTTLASGASATAAVRAVSGGYVIDLGIPQGAAGTGGSGGGTAATMTDAEIQAAMGA